ncbi:hypothetical protein niasHS_005728 [Heterodera schachtii]|uniref:Xaa-Pro dipeptidase n=1 Tax=Heterodera schachtii TaxID=97005 RepID=A0ABD2JZ98_HETSC
MSFCRGPNTFSVPAQLFVDNRVRLVKALREKLGGAAPGTCVLLEGGKDNPRYNTDTTDSPFRQESYFFWAFGVHEPDCFAAVDVESGKSAIFPPKMSPDSAIWDGKIQPEKWFLDKYKVDHVNFQTNGAEIGQFLHKLFNAKKLLLLKAENTDSGKVLEPAKFPGMDSFSVDLASLYPTMAELRVIKTEFELAVLRYASKIANEAHKEVMRHVRPEMYEYQLESLFRHISYYTGGCRHLGYTCIAASGENAAVLHYGHCAAPNDKVIRDGDICLFDMGPEYNCYISDVTCSFPANGKFTEKQKIVYNAVLRANRTVLGAAKPVILEDLLRAGILRGDVDEMLGKRMGALFMPHGLGHFMGLDTHDVGGYLGDALPRSDKPGLKSLRTTRTLKERMCITIEPGCYFIDSLLDKALADSELSKHINADRLNEFRGTGGVRIEDDVIIWEKGNENMNADVPRTVEEIEQFMAKAKGL